MPNADAGRVAAFSSGGLAFDGHVKPELVAPGVGIATTDAGTAAEGGPRYATATGSSAAAAVVAASAAALAQARPGLSVGELKSLLVGSARQLSRERHAGSGHRPGRRDGRPVRGRRGRARRGAGDDRLRAGRSATAGRSRRPSGSATFRPDGSPCRLRRLARRLGRARPELRGGAGDGLPARRRLGRGRADGVGRRAARGQRRRNVRRRAAGLSCGADPMGRVASGARSPRRS